MTKCRIITDGENFRVEIFSCEHGYNLDTTSSSSNIEHLFESSTENGARDFILKKYGTSAKIEPRTWRPI